MILEKNSDTGWYTDIFINGKQGRLNNTHAPEACEDRGCGIHDHPSDHPLKDAPMNWRSDRGILERICDHGIGHPDRDSPNRRCGDADRPE
jgi:hypothetical protein